MQPDLNCLVNKFSWLYKDNEKIVNAEIPSNSLDDNIYHFFLFLNIKLKSK